MKPFLIVNPMSGNGRTGRYFDEVVSAVQGAVGGFDHAFTERSGDATRMAREAIHRGAELVVAVGGDGTANEVVNGFFEGGKSINPAAAFALLPRGTGGDLRRSIGWSSELKSAARALSEVHHQACDVGSVDFLDADGRAAQRYFVNVADFGIGGVVANEVNHGTKALGGKLSFFLGSARGLLKYKDKPVRYRFDGGEWQEESLTALAVCNGRYFGGGMMVAPRAQMNDGLFDITIWKGFGFVDFAIRSGKLYDGSHVDLPNTRTARARMVEAEPIDGCEVLLDVDGEQPGRLPARFRMLEGALRVKAPAPS